MNVVVLCSYRDSNLDLSYIPYIPFDLLIIESDIIGSCYYYLRVHTFIIILSVHKKRK